MIVDVTQLITDLDGKPMEDKRPDHKKGDDIPDLTLRATLTSCLMANFDDEKDLSGADKLKRFNLANKINKAETTFKFGGEDLVLIKKLVAKACAISVTGRVFNMLEEESVADPAKEESVADPPTEEPEQDLP